jgi:hypothetical protein
MILAYHIYAATRITPTMMVMANIKNPFEMITR